MSICQGCSTASHPGGRIHCPAYNQICFNCQKIGHFAKVCRSKLSQQQGTPTTGVQRNPHPGQHSLSTTDVDTTDPRLDNIQYVASSDPAPSIYLDIIATNGCCNTRALPDSGADISAAGKAILSTLNDSQGSEWC